MYEWIEGTLASVTPTYLVIDQQGIGYRLLVANPYRWQSYLGNKIKCFVELVVREDSMTLYGFTDAEEKQLFLTLNRVSGIGPKSALSILAADDHVGLMQAIDNGDSQYLTKFPGVGKKTAQQMVLDLKGELKVEVDLPTLTNETTQQMVYSETLEALVGLGYSTKEIKRIEKSLLEHKFSTTQEALKIAFKLLLK